ncbi:F-box protein CPR1-like isoform X2 [Amaranthus tricolor]|nr:F-box protein CPR1-like isoform X2 [Amaranthus tricolor]
MAALPKEIITEILSRLPVKSLLRFTSVCKSWYFLIKNPNFAKLHLNQSLISQSNRHLILFHHSLYFSQIDLDSNHLSFLKINHPLDHQKTIVLGSCNGVTCISNFSKSEFFLFNPLTKSHRKLPSIPIQDPKDEVIFGFGYDSKNDDYKVLRMLEGYNYKTDEIFYNEAKVYSLNNHSWKTVDALPYYLFYKNFYGALVNENLHYSVLVEQILDSEYMSIARFDLQTERFSLMSYPIDIYGDIFKSGLMLVLGQLDGCLCLMVNYQTIDLGGLLPLPTNEVQGPLLKRVDLWVMKEYGKEDSWVRLFSICQPESIGCYIHVLPLVYSGDGRRILLDLDALRFGWYDLVSNSVDEIIADGLPLGYLESSFFVGSLVCVSLQDKLSLKKKTLPKKNKKKCFSGSLIYYFISIFFEFFARKNSACWAKV